MDDKAAEAAGCIGTDGLKMVRDILATALWGDRNGIQAQLKQ
ncbi:MAG: hypothetical protein NTX06_11165 [Proteobacteria bacterium]|nr:hypothetical protein [Pseudomonadota bacterium]